MVQRVGNGKVVSLADKLIDKPNFKRTLVKKKYNTQDIVQQIVHCKYLGTNDTKRFARYLRGPDEMQTCRNVWRFIKLNVKYVLDPEGVQYVKTPAITWHERFSDCKGYSNFMHSLLTNLKMPVYFRFVSYSDKPKFTHVYCVVPVDGKFIVLDACMPGFNMEKAFKHKLDLK